MHRRKVFDCRMAVAWWFLVLPMVSWASVSSNDELYCLALNIYHEARGESIEGQMAVAFVTMNRVINQRYPSSVCDVVWQPGQFSWTNDGRSDRPGDRRAWSEAQRVASFVYADYHQMIELTGGAFDLTNGALYYYAPRHVRPGWARYKVVTRKIGSHLFLRD